MEDMTIDEQISNIDRSITKTIESLQVGQEGYCSQVILAQLRNLIEAIGLKLINHNGEQEFLYKDIKSAFARINQRHAYKFLVKFKESIGIVASHYTLDEYNSKKIMQKYVGYLIKLRESYKAEFGIDLLCNIELLLEKRNLLLDRYYKEIWHQIKTLDLDLSAHKEYFYPISTKPIFIEGEMMYEISFSKTRDNSSKLGNLIAYSEFDMPMHYRVCVELSQVSIQIEGLTLPFNIMRSYAVAVYPSEINLLGRIVGCTLHISGNYPEYRNLMSYMTQTGEDLLDIICYSDDKFSLFKKYIADGVRKENVVNVINKCRNHIKNGKGGTNVLRYILKTLSMNILKKQIAETPHGWFDGLHLNSGCKPFDDMPFCTSLLGHNPPFNLVLESIPVSGREHELLAKVLEVSAEKEGRIFNDATAINLGDIGKCISDYNSKLCQKHKTSRPIVLTKHNHIYIEEYAQVTADIMSKLIALSKCCLYKYTTYVKSKICDASGNLNSLYKGYDDDKLRIIQTLFSQSCVAVLNGPAGTGKTTFIDFFTKVFSGTNILFLANTIPAVENIRSRCGGLSENICMTVSKFLAKHASAPNYSCNFLIIDECSTIPNKHIRAILEKVSAKSILLVGDPFQLGSINFGNWFNIINSFLPPHAINILSIPHRASAKILNQLWESVRNLDDKILERLTAGDFLSKLDKTLFNRTNADEIILALNYNGLYGINNINAYFQSNNHSKSIRIGAYEYKVSDPILFSETERFHDFFNNNLKGVIADVNESSDHYQFDVWVNKPVIFHPSFVRIIDDSNLTPPAEGDWTLVSFAVYKQEPSDDGENEALYEVPFHVAYAVSIHKAQGLEFNSVKIVITDEIEEQVTHDVFYTAITRSKQNLKIFWDSPNPQKMFDNFITRQKSADANLLSLYKSIPLYKPCNKL